MLFTDDPVYDHEMYQEEQEKHLRIRPLCDCCENHVQDDYYYEINDEVICQSCMDRYYKKSVDDYIE